jgi:hypothetical protein
MSYFLRNVSRTRLKRDRLSTMLKINSKQEIASKKKSGNNFNLSIYKVKEYFVILKQLVTLKKIVKLQKLTMK